MQQLSSASPASTVSSTFSLLNDNLKLDPNERIAAERLHNEISAVLMAAGITVGSFLQGSFARKTMKPPLHDIDKVLLLKPSLRSELDDPLGPRRSMQMITNALSPAFPGATFEIGRHALAMDFREKWGFKFDAVPAFDTDGEDIYIADTENVERGLDPWRWSNTRTLIRVIRERNRDTGKLFVPQVRIVKAFSDDIVPGLHVETAAFGGITTSLPDPTAVTQALEYGATMFGGDYFDPTGVDMISKRLDQAVRAEAQRFYADRARLARQALRLQQGGDEIGAIAIWSEMAGDFLPDVPVQSVQEVFGLLGSGAGVTRQGVVTASAAHKAQPVRSWSAS